MEPSERDVDEATSMLLRNMNTQVSINAPSQKSAGESDSEQMANLEKHIGDLQLALQSLQTNLRNRISAAQQARNTLAPIHRLPAELLLPIFALALQEEGEDTPGRNYYKAMGKIAMVSKSFYELIDNSASMWSFFVSGLSPSFTRKVLAKSGSSPLSVTCDRYIDSAGRKLLELLSNDTRRFRSLQIPVDATACVQKILKSPAPVLETLFLWTSIPHPYPLEIFGGKAPRLRDLTTQGVPLKMEGDMFTGLRTLEVKEIDYHAPTVSRLLEVIASSPRLETLVLEKIKFTDNRQESLPDEGRIQLPYLKTLSLELSAGAVTAFLRRLQIPNCSKLHLTCPESSYMWDDESLPADYVSGPLEQFATLLRSVERTTPSHVPLHIELGPRSISYRIRNVEIDLPVASPTQVVEWIVTVVDAKRMKRKCILQLQHDINLADKRLHACLDKLPCVTRLQLLVLRDAQPILQYLSHRSRVGWPLPRMSELSIDDNSVDPYEIVDMVRARFGNASQSKKTKSKGKGKPRSKSSDLPVPLTSLDLEGIRPYDDGAFESLADLIGEENVYWEPEDEDEEEFYHDQYNYSDGDPYSDEEYYF